MVDKGKEGGVVVEEEGEEELGKEGRRGVWRRMDESRTWLERICSMYLGLSLPPSTNGIVSLPRVEETPCPQGVSKGTSGSHH